jgi:hypothetical protein
MTTTYAPTLPMFKMPDGKNYMTVVGLAAWLHNTYVVAIPPRGETKLYCQKHERLFKTTDTCPECGTQPETVKTACLEKF